MLTGPDHRGYYRSNGTNAPKIANLNLGGAAQEAYDYGCVRDAPLGFEGTYYDTAGILTTTLTAASRIYAVPIVGMNIGIASTTTTSAVSQTTSSTPASKSAPSGLSTGAKADIGIGAALGAILIFGSLISLVLKKRNKKQAVSTSSVNHARHELGTYQQKQELDGRGVGYPTRSHRPPQSLKEDDTDFPWTWISGWNV